MRFENLGDPADDWMGRAFAEVIGTGLSTLPNTTVLWPGKLHGFDQLLVSRIQNVPGIAAERQQALLAGATRILYGDYDVHAGKLRARVTIEDVARTRTVKVIELTAATTDPIAFGEALVRQLGGDRAYGTRRPQALRGFVIAQEAVDAPAVLKALDDALAIDPGYASAALMMVQLKLSAQDRAGAGRVVEAALRANTASPSDRARLEMDAAAIAGDTQARVRALNALVRANPNDPASWRALGEDSFAGHRYPEAMRAFERTVALDPTDAVSLNMLGYSAVRAGSLSAAVEALNRYRAVRPAEPNPLDSMGDVHYYAGRFAESEAWYVKANQKDPNFLNGGTLYKAALAHLMTGDVPGADAVAARYWAAREAAKDPILAYRKGEWEWLAGRRQNAVKQVTEYGHANANGPLREMAARAYAQAALWKLALGDREGAVPLARLSVATTGPGTAAVAAMANFVTGTPATAGEWAVRGERAFPQPGQRTFKNFAVAYALLLGRHFKEAAPLLRELYDSPQHVGDDTIATMLGWSYLETNRTNDAAPLLAAYPVSSPNGASPFVAFHFPRIFYLQGVLAERQQNRETARSRYETFLKLSGPDALLWGEEAQARLAVK